MSLLKDYELDNKSILKNIYSSGKLNWIFIPGGPGLGPEYLINFFEKNKFFKNSNVFIFKFPKISSQVSDHNYFTQISNDIMQIEKELNNVILVGHSFGGMFLQVLNFNETNFKKIILLNTSPNLECFNLANDAFEKFENEKKYIIQKAELEYSHEKNNNNYKNLYKAWQPYYVSHELKQDYLKMIDACTVDYELYEWGNRFFNNYFSENSKIPKNSIAISALKDIMCPPQLFKEYETQLCNIHTLTSSSHFPWLDNKVIFTGLLQKIEEEVDY